MRKVECTNKDKHNVLVVVIRHMVENFLKNQIQYQYQIPKGSKD